MPVPTSAAAPLLIRPGRSGDADAAADLMLGIPGGMNHLVRRRSMALRLARAAWLSPESGMGRALVAESDGEVVGIAIRFPGSAWGGIRRATGRAMLRAIGWRRVMILYWRGRPMDRLMAPIAPDAMHVMSLAVAPERRGQGIGAELMARVAEEARSAKLRSVSLDVDVDNDAAIRFYEREGFVGTQERHIRAGRGLPEIGSIRMRRDLSRGP